MVGASGARKLSISTSCITGLGSTGISWKGRVEWSSLVALDEEGRVADKADRASALSEF